MSLHVVGLQCGPCLQGETPPDRLGALAQAFEAACDAHPTADLVVFPELMGHPYFCLTRDPDAFGRSEPLDGPTVQRFAALARRRAVAVLLTIFERQLQPDGSWRHHNTAVLLDRHGAMAGVYRKTHVPTLGLATLPADEAYYFSPGDSLPVFTLEGVTLGVLICFDRSFPEAARALVDQGAELILIPAASSGQERAARWVGECAARAMESGVFVIGVNRAGVETALPGQQVPYFGSSCACAPDGSLIAALDDQAWATLSVRVDPQDIAPLRRALPFLNLRREGLYGTRVSAVARVRQALVDPGTAPGFHSATNQPKLENAHE
jgi:N-carbamoylputrescine amidase